MCIRDRLYFGRIVPWENRNDKTPEIEQCSEQVYQDMEPVSYTHLDVYKRQPQDDLMERLLRARKG